MLYKLGLLNRPELNKVYHSFYNLFLGRIQGVKIGGFLENTLSNIIYRIRVLQELKNCRN
jgi:lysyl-tRNA synthetase class I